jgi:hypothetical protein
MESFKAVDFKIIDRKVYFNTGKFMFRDNSPKIYAEEMATGNPIDVNVWNTVRKYNYVLTNTNGYTKLKKMPNPMYKYYVTFLSSTELKQMQSFKNIFMALHPDIVTYNFNNLWFGQIDIHTVIDLKASVFNELEVYEKKDGQKYDRIGVGYQVSHTFKKVKPNDAVINLLKDKQLVEEAEILEPVFTLATELTMLMVDKAPNDIAGFMTTQRNRPMAEEQYTLTELKNNMAMLCGDDSNPARAVNIDIDSIPKAGPNSVANTQIAVAGAELLKKGFSYDQSDCSNFVMKAVRAAGADVGKDPYPDGTLAQFAWFLKYKNNGIELVEDLSQVKPGDIAFFHSQNRDNGHVVIALDNQKFMHSAYSKIRGQGGAAVRPFAGYSLKKPTYIFRILPVKADAVNKEKK